MTQPTLTNCRYIFAGTPDFAAVHLQALIHAGLMPLAVYTQPDRPAGRGKKLQASAVKELALHHQIPVLQPVTLKDESTQQTLKAFAADLIIVVAYGLLLPESILNIPARGCINVHASLLPRWRGAAPIQRAIAAGDEKSGVCLMQMEKGLDTGPILATTEVAIATLNGGQLHDLLAAKGAELLLGKIAEICQGKIKTCPQNAEHATYAHKLNKSEAHLDWNKSAVELERLIHAFNPWPVCFSQVGDYSLRIWEATEVSFKLHPPADKPPPPGTLLALSEEGIWIQTGDGVLNLAVIQLPSRKKMPVADILRGQKDLFHQGMKFQ